jgi:hypothetical protein
MAGLFNPELLDDTDPFEIDTHSAHLFKHPYRGIEDIPRGLVRRPAVLPR